MKTEDNNLHSEKLNYTNTKNELNTSEQEVLSYLKNNNFINAINTFKVDQTALYLSHSNIGDIGVKDLVDVLKINHTFTTLSLKSNKIGDVGAKDLGEMLKVNHTFTTLDLSYNNIGAAGAKACYDRFIQNMPSLFLTCYNNVALLKR